MIEGQLEIIKEHLATEQSQEVPPLTDPYPDIDGPWSAFEPELTAFKVELTPDVDD